ncbi:MAG TPA: tetratricopeptide repeat protein [Myxococcales bacterium]|nr:tetratricopeptide repeat protein [Myxococcales bacterium]
MAKSPIERYEQILAADPSSLVFVELAKALVEGGQMQKAVRVCQDGLNHHPESIIGRVLWGKALLLSGQPAEAMEQFEKAGQIEPENPYAYNLVSEILIQKRLFRSALPILRKAVALQPTDAKVRQWLDQATAESHDSLVPIADQALGDDRTMAFMPSWAGPSGSGIAPLVATPQAPKRTPSVPPPAPEGAMPKAAPRRESSAPQPVPRADSSAPKPPPLRESSGPKPPPLRDASGSKAAPPPLRPPPVPVRAGPSDRLRAIDLLGELPDVEGPKRSIPEVSAQEAKALADKYEEKLRQEYSLKHDAPVSWLRRHWLGLTVAGSVAGAVGVSSGGYMLYRRHFNEQHEREFLDRARSGLLLDTEASITGASHQVAEVLETDPKQPVARALAAQTAATLFREYGGPATLRDEARAALQDAALFKKAPDAAWTARYLLSDDPKELAAPVLALPADKAGPWVDYLAGRLLLAKGQPAEALKRFDLGLKKASAHVPTLLAVGDYYLKAGDYDHAAQFFTLAHGASAQSVGGAVGLAEAHLGLHQAGAEDEKALAAVAGKGVPDAWRLRLDLATARVLALDGQHDKAVTLLTDGLAKHGEDAGAYAAALADVGLAAGRYLEALPQAQRAAEKAPRRSEALERYARVLLGLGRYRQLLAKVPAVGADPRPLHVFRARAYYDLGECGGARREIEATRRGEKIPAGAAVVLALCDAADGQVKEAKDTLGQLAALPSPPVPALLALGDVDRLAGDARGAQAAYQKAAAADATAYEPHCSLGRLYIAARKRGDGERELEAALKLNVDHAEAQVALGTALLADGNAEGAVSHMQAAMQAAPEDEAAALGAGNALLALKMIPDALRYATRATVLAPDDPEAHRLRGRVAQAAKQKHLAQSELKLAGRLEKKKREEARAKARAKARHRRA